MLFLLLRFFFSWVTFLWETAWHWPLFSLVNVHLVARGKITPHTTIRRILHFKNQRKLYIMQYNLHTATTWCWILRWLPETHLELNSLPGNVKKDRIWKYRATSRSQIQLFSKSILKLDFRTQFLRTYFFFKTFFNEIFPKTLFFAI